MIIFYKGDFAKAVTYRLCEIFTCRIFDMLTNDINDIVLNHDFNHAAVISSTMSVEAAMHISNILYKKNVRWTSVYVGPRHIRIGPLIDGKAPPCFKCATNRYLSAPGSNGLAMLEIIGNTKDKNFDDHEFTGYLTSTVEMAASEIKRQIISHDLEAGFIRKIDLLNVDILDALPTYIHGCETCVNIPIKDRFHNYLVKDLSQILKQERL